MGYRPKKELYDRCKKKDQLCAKKSKIRFEYAEKNFFHQINSILKKT